MTTPPDDLVGRCIEAVVRDGERFGVVAELLDTGRTPVQGGLEVAVPWVQAWTARDLVLHLGTVHRWVTGILRAGAAGQTGAPPAPQPHGHPLHGPDLHGWFALGLTELVATLRTTDPTTATWHMSPAAGTALDWARRQASEHLVHRLDLEAAAGLAHDPVDADLATDGVDELLRIVVPRWAHAEPLATSRSHVRVRTTDTRRTWDVVVHNGAVRCSSHADADADTPTTVTVAVAAAVAVAQVPGTGSPDAMVGGTAEQLLRHLWGRPANVEVTGDPAAESLLRGR